MLQLPDPRERQVPVIPPTGERLRLLIDTDCANEVDDQLAVALAILSPERFEIEGFVGSQFDNERGGPTGIQKSVDEINRILDLAGMSGRWPVKPGSHPMQYRGVPVKSAGVDLIIERAMAGSANNPLWIVGLGAATDMASAFLQEPRIVDRVRVFWHFRTRWPEKAWNFNVVGDIIAARHIYHSALPFVLFDTGTHLTLPVEEGERLIKPHGKLGQYLHDIRLRSEWWRSPRKGFYDLGDVAALYDPSLGKWEITPCPEIAWDLSYEFKGTMGSILRCYDVDREGVWALFSEKLRRHAAEQSTRM